MRYTVPSQLILKSGIRFVPQLGQQTFLVESSGLNRCFSSNSLAQARTPGSIFGWNIFGKIKKPFLQKQEEPNNEIPSNNNESTEVKSAEWVSIEEKISSSLESPAKKIVLTKDHISRIFYEQIRINHPDAKESSTSEELLALSIEDPKTKLKVLPSLEEALNEASSSKLYNYPNRNLHNSQTVQDVFAYYALEEERIGAFAGFPLEQFFRKLKETSINDSAAALPANLVFKPYVPKQRKHRDVIPGCKHIPKKVKTSMPKKGGDKRLPPRHLRNHL